MPQAKFKFSAIPTDLAQLDLENKNETKFYLFLKQRQIDELSNLLDQIMLWPNKYQRAWVKRYQTEIKTLMTGFLDSAMSIFSNTLMDKELMQLGANYTQQMRLVTDKLNHIVGIGKKIKG